MTEPPGPVPIESDALEDRPEVVEAGVDDTTAPGFAVPGAGEPDPDTPAFQAPGEPEPHLGQGVDAPE